MQLVGRRAGSRLSLEALRVEEDAVCGECVRGWGRGCVLTLSLSWRSRGLSSGGGCRIACVVLLGMELPPISWGVSGSGGWCRIPQWQLVNQTSLTSELSSFLLVASKDLSFHFAPPLCCRRRRRKDPVWCSFSSGA
jgi:hypothetical protein